MHSAQTNLPGPPPPPHLSIHQHILVAPDKKDLIPQLRQRVEAGETLAALAAEHSQCPSRRCRVGGEGAGQVCLVCTLPVHASRASSQRNAICSSAYNHILHAISRSSRRSNGGSIGWIGKGQTVPEFEAAAFGTAPGGLAVCTTRFGVHLLQVLAER